MARTASITLTLDGGQPLRIIGQIQGEIGSIGKAAEREARKVEGEFTKGFKAAASSARSFASATVSSFIGNLASSAASAATAAVSSFLTQSVKAAVEAADAQRFLANAVASVGGSFDDAKAKAADLGRTLGMSMADAERALAQVTMALQGTGVDPVQYLRRLADAAAGAGRTLKDIDIGSLVAGIVDEPFDRLGLGNPGAIVEAAAKARGLKTADLTDQQRKAFLAEAVMKQGERFGGAAAGRAGDLGGQLDQIAAKVENIQAKFGALIGRNEGVRMLLDTLNKGLDQAAKGGSVFGLSLKDAQKTLGSIAEAAAWIGGKAAEVFVGLQVVADTIAVSIRVWPKVIGVAFAQINRLAAESVASFVDLLRNNLPTAAQEMLGLGNVDTQALRDKARAELDDAQAEGRELLRVYDERIGQNLNRIETIKKATEAAMKQAREIGEAFARTAPETDPSKGAASSAAKPAQRPVVIVTGVDDANIPFMRSVNPSDPVFRGNVQAGETVRAQTSATAANTEATQQLGKKVDELGKKIEGAAIQVEFVVDGEAVVTGFTPMGGLRRAPAKLS